MKHNAMNHEAISQIVFDEHYAVPADQTAPRLFRQLPLATHYCEELVDVMATAYLIAVLESICLRELHRHIDQEQERVVGTSVECWHCAPVPVGAVLRLSGWVESMGDSEVTFRMQARDEQEHVCEASIRLVIVHRKHIEQHITRKKEAIERRQLFQAA